MALPLTLAQIAAVGVGFVDTVMAGAAGKDELAAVALGSAAFSTLYITWLGVMTALNPMISQLWGAGKTAEVGETGRQGLWFGLLLGMVVYHLNRYAANRLKAELQPTTGKA